MGSVHGDLPRASRAQLRCVDQTGLPYLMLDGSQIHRIRGYSELEGFHEDHGVQLLNEWSIHGTERGFLSSALQKCLYACVHFLKPIREHISNSLPDALAPQWQRFAYFCGAAQCTLEIPEATCTNPWCCAKPWRNPSVVSEQNAFFFFFSLQ